MPFVFLKKQKIIKLTKREEIFIAIGGICIFLFLVIGLVVYPMIDKRKQRIRILQIKTKEYEEIVALKKIKIICGKCKTVSKKEQVNKKQIYPKTVKEAVYTILN